MANGLLSGLGDTAGGFLKRGFSNVLGITAHNEKEEAARIAEQNRRISMLDKGIDPNRIGKEGYAEEYIKNKPSAAEIKGEFLNALDLRRRMEADPSLKAQYSTSNIAELDNYIATKAKGAENVFNIAQAGQYGKDTAAIKSARELEAEKAMGKELLQEAPTGELTPVIGSPRYLEQQEKAAQQQKQAELDLSQREVINQQVDNALSVLEGPSLLPKTGTLSPIISQIKETKAGELDSYLDSIRSNVALNKLIEVKAAGGTFGALQKNEMDALEASLGKLKTAQNPRVLKQNLENVKRYYNKAVQSAGGDLESALDSKLEELGASDKQSDPLGLR